MIMASRHFMNGDHSNRKFKLVIVMSKDVMHSNKREGNVKATTNVANVVF
jgi:hypothetical protein